MNNALLVVPATAVAGDLAIYYVGVAGWGVPGEFRMLNPLAIVVAAALGVAVAAIVLAVLARLTRRAVTIFVAGVVAATVASLAAPIQAMAGTMPGTPAATRATGISMIAMHLFTGSVICWLLPRAWRRAN